MRTFLKRLAIFLTLPAALLGALSVYWNLNRTDGRGDYIVSWVLAFWCAFVWGIYWVISPLTRPSARRSQAPHGPVSGQVSGASESQKAAGWAGLRVLSAGGSLEDAASAVEKMERQTTPRDG